MNHPAAAQKAKARARVRARPANDNVVRLAPLALTAEYVVPEESEEAPFEPPPADDIFGLGECDEEETLFVSDGAIEEDAPFDPPEFEDEPVFSPPALVAAPPPPEEPPKPQPAPEAPRVRAVPAISIYASWDRPDSEPLLQAFASDPRLARATTTIARGGLDGATAHFSSGASADLVVLDTTLQGGPMLAALDRLIEVLPAKARIVVLGAVNDIGLLRELAARNVSDYIVPPAGTGDLVRSACQLFADADTAHVIAVIGARGGVGASTIAQNVAWSIAERQQQRVTLAELDLSFGSAAFNFQHETEVSIADVMRAGDDLDQVLTKALARPTPRLQLLPAPPSVESIELDPNAFEAAMAEIRRASPYVVLDLPHVWEPWVRSALRDADEIVIVAGADLASLRNADNMLKLMRSERDKASAPVIVLSMSGVPKRPEIPLKDFSEALCVKPAMTFAFEPELFAKAEASGQMIYETMPDAKAALQLDALATLLTGHEPIARPSPRGHVAPVKKPEAGPAPDVEKVAPMPAAELPVLDLVVQAPPEQPPQRRRRRVARSGFLALQMPPPQQKHPTGIVRAAMLALTLILAGAWYVQHQSESANVGAPEPTSAFRA